MDVGNLGRRCERDDACMGTKREIENYRLTWAIFGKQHTADVIRDVSAARVAYKAAMQLRSSSLEKPEVE